MRKRIVGKRLMAGIVIAAISMTSISTLGTKGAVSVSAEEADSQYIDMTALNVETYCSENDGGWAGDKGVTFSYEKNKVIVSAENFGWNAWGIQWKLHGLESSLDDTALEFDVVSSVDKSINVKNEASGVMETVQLKAGQTVHYKTSTGKTADFTFDLTGGAVGGTLTFTNMKFGDYKPVAVAPVLGKEHDFTNTESDYADPGLEKEGMELIWADEFDGNYGDANVDPETGLNLDNWSYQLGDGSTDCGNYGWGNNELQCYTKDVKNIGVNEDLTGDGEADGLLRITASYEENGYKYASESVKKYTSARIRTSSNTETLFTTTYGYVESRIALPATKGAWPAFWMLPESTSIYGGWPVSGEIDILETVGANLNQACGTLHWGVPSHVYKGSGYVDMPSGSDNTAFHTYAINWVPGQIEWIYDGEVIYTSNNWSSGIAGASDALGFDAPFDAPFYAILNLAVDSGQFGGTANKADFKTDINMYVDYVRVFQDKNGYAESVVPTASKGAKTDWADYAGLNQIAEIEADNLDASAGSHDDNAAKGKNKWYLSTQSDANASAEVVIDASGKVWHKVSIGQAGSQDYSVQLIGHYDAKAGYVYKVSFDAYADGAIVNKAVNCDSKEYNGWSTYGVSPFTLTEKSQSYSYMIEQTEDFDNCRIEFNLGAQATGNVYISNVKVEIVEPSELGKDDENGSHPALANGELIYNGSFDQGNHRTGYWETKEGTSLVVPRYTTEALTDSDVQVVDVASMTNYENIENGIKYYERRGQVSAEEGKAPVIYQSGLKLKADTYTLAFDLFSETDTYVKASIYSVKEKDGQFVLDEEIAKATASYKATSGMKNLTLKLTTDEGLENAALVLTFARDTKVQIDHVSMFGLNPDTEIDTRPMDKDTTWRGDNGGGGELPSSLSEDGVLTFSNLASGGTWYTPQIASSDFSMVSGIDYVLTFKYKLEGQSNQTLQYILQENGGNWAVINDSEKTLVYDANEADAEGFNTYRLAFKCYGTIPNTHLVFGFGNSGAVGDLKFTAKDISLVKLSAVSVDADNEELKDESVFLDKKTEVSDDNDKDETDKDETNKDETDKDETDKDETDKNETSKDETGKDETGKGETGKDETVKDETSKDETDKDLTDKDNIKKPTTEKEEEVQGIREEKKDNSSNKTNVEIPSNEQTSPSPSDPATKTGDASNVVAILMLLLAGILITLVSVFVGNRRDKFDIK